LMADPTPGNSDELSPGVSNQHDSPASQISAPDISASDDELVALAQSEIEEAKALDSVPTADSEAYAASKMAPFDGTFLAATTAAEGGAKRARSATADSAETPVSPPAPPNPSAESLSFADAVVIDSLTPATDKPRENPLGPASPLKAPDHPNEISRGHQGAALNAASIVAAALTGALRHPEPLGTASAGAASKDSRTTAPSVLDRLAVKTILDNLRRSQAQASASQAAPMTGAGAKPPVMDGEASNGAFPAGGLRDKLWVFTADRMQARRDGEQVRGAMQSGTAVLASLEPLERRETAGILNKIRDAAKANGGIENVLSEMRPGGAFEDLRKEFNVALSHDEGFAAAYEKAASALSGYAETRAGMISAPSPRADVSLAHLEVLDREIGAATKALPGLKDGKTALDEALEGGKEAIEKAFSAVREAFTGDPSVRGPSPSPSFGP
jgi:hypothetical protein